MLTHIKILKDVLETIYFFSAFFVGGWLGGVLYEALKC